MVGGFDLSEPAPLAVARAPAMWMGDSPFALSNAIFGEERIADAFRAMCEPHAEGYSHTGGAPAAINPTKRE